MSLTLSRLAQTAGHRFLISLLLPLLLLTGACGGSHSSNGNGAAQPSPDRTVDVAAEAASHASKACSSEGTGWKLYLRVMRPPVAPQSVFAQYAKAHESSVSEAQQAAALDRRYSPLAHLVAPYWGIDESTSSTFQDINNWCLAEGL